MPDKNTVTYLNVLFARIGVWSLRHRWLVFAASLLIILISVMLSANVRMNNSFDAYFDSSDATYAAYLQYREDFGSDEIAYLLYDAGSLEHGVFDLALMQKIARLTTRLKTEVPFVKDVKSLANVQLMMPAEDGLEIIALEEDFPQTQAQLLVFAEQLMQKRMFIDGYVTADRRFGAIRIDMEKSSIDPIDAIRLDPEGGDGLENVYPQVSDTVISQILADPAYADIDFHISGDVPMNSAYNRIAISDMSTTGLLSLAIIAVLLLVFFRFSAIGLIGPLAVVMLSIIITVGFIGLLGWDLDMMFAMVPTMLISLGIAHAVHIISEFRIFHARYQDRAKAIQETLHLVGAPCLLTSLTTAAGFLAMSFSPIKTLSHMAIYTSLAVVAAFFLSITLLCFFLSFGKAQDSAKIQSRYQRPAMDKLLTAIAEFNIRHSRAVLVAAALIFTTAGIGIARVEVDSNFLLDFAKDEPIRVSTEYIDNTMGGMSSIVYLFDSQKSDGIKNPATLLEIERLQAFIDAQTPLVRKTYSIVDLLKDINQSFHGGDPAYYKIPESQQLIAQYLLVYELSGGDELFDFVSEDFSRANLEVRTQMVNSSELAALKASIEAYQRQQPLTHSQNQFSGVGALWVQLIDYISQSQLQGVALALLTISLMMCFIFRSIKIGLISMIPNVAPAVVAVGLIGWLDIHLDYIKLMIAPIAIGIAVDDTIHMLTRFQYEFNKRGNYRQALIATMTGVGRALLITSVVLVCGFMSYTIAQMDGQFWFGILLALTIVVALLADFFVMPALILCLKPFGPERSESLNADELPAAARLQN